MLYAQYQINGQVVHVVVVLYLTQQPKLPVFVSLVSHALRTGNVQQDPHVWMMHAVPSVLQIEDAWVMNVVTLHQESANHCVAEMMTAAVERSVRGLFVLLVAEVILAVLLIGHASTVSA